MSIQQPSTSEFDERNENVLACTHGTLWFKPRQVYVCIGLKLGSTQ